MSSGSSDCRHPVKRLDATQIIPIVTTVLSMNLRCLCKRLLRILMLLLFECEICRTKPNFYAGNIFDVRQNKSFFPRSYDFLLLTESHRQRHGQRITHSN
jgi:hypothetical protein